MLIIKPFFIEGIYKTLIVLVIYQCEHVVHVLQQHLYLMYTSSCLKFTKQYHTVS